MSSMNGIKRLTPAAAKRILPSRPKPQRPRTKATRKVTGSIGLLRNLISLHHTSASFLHDPEDLPHGFDNAFQHTHNEPEFTPFTIWRDDTLRTSSASTSHLGLPDLIPRRYGKDGFDDHARRTPIGRPVTRYSKVFEKYDQKWSERDLGNGSDLSDRELQVKEALFGTWERGGKGMKDIEPGLEGMMEYLNAKGVTAKQFAAEWMGKDEPEFSSDREKRLDEEKDRQEKESAY